MVCCSWALVLFFGASLADGLSGPGPRWSTSGKSTSSTPKWAGEVDDFAERIESAKTAVAGGIASSVAAAPIGLLIHVDNVPQWEFNIDQLSLMGALFGLVYRYAVREDNNPQLRQGVVGAFALTRALSAVRVSDTCSPIPLSCGAPLSYLDYGMLWQLGTGLVESGVAFAAAAFFIDYGSEKGYLRRFK